MGLLGPANCPTLFRPTSSEQGLRAIRILSPWEMRHRRPQNDHSNHLTAPHPITIFPPPQSNSRSHFNQVAHVSPPLCNQAHYPMFTDPRPWHEGRRRRVQRVLRRCIGVLGLPALDPDGGSPTATSRRIRGADSVRYSDQCLRPAWPWLLATKIWEDLLETHPGVQSACSIPKPKASKIYFCL